MTEFWKLLRRIKNYKTNLVLSIISNILLSIFTVASIPAIIPFFQILFNRVPEQNSGAIPNDITAYFQDLIYSQGKENALWIVCGMIILIFFLKNVFRYFAMYFLVPLRTGIVRDIRSEIFDQYLHLPLSYFKREKTGDLLSRLTLDVQEIEISILKVIEVLFKAPLIIVGSILFMLYVSPQLSIFVLLLLLFTVFVIGTISKTLKRNSMHAQRILGQLTSTAEESISGIKVIKAFGAEEAQSEKFYSENNDYRSILMRIMHRQNLSSPLSEFLGITVVTFLLWYGSQLVFKNSLQPETFFAFIFAFYQVIEPAKSFSSAYYNIQKGMAAVERIEALTNLPTEIKSTSSDVLHLENNIQINNLSFSYPNEVQEVLKDISLTINKGEVIALVGPSGGGKTTLIDLLMGFYPINKGEILVDNTPIKKYGVNQLRSLYSLVSQHAVLFHDSIKNNLVFGKVGVDDKKIIEASNTANAHDFIMNTSNGYNTIIGDRGMNLSGGQRQRLTIARAIIANADVLILDEATSSLDSESEQLVQEALDKIMHKKTSIVIAHRLSTIKNADRIYVINDGRLIAHGKHEELYHTTPLYRKLVDIQGV